MLTYRRSADSLLNTDEAPLAPNAVVHAKDLGYVDLATPPFVYRFGWRGQSDRITVSFLMPTSAGMEILSIAVQVAAWGMVSPSVWRAMILRNLPLGVIDYPVQG